MACLCPQLLRGLPTDNIISFFCVHSLCSTGLDVLHELLRRGVKPESAGLARSAQRPAWASGRWRADRLEEGVRQPFCLHPAPPDLLRLLLCVARVHEHEQIDVGFHMHDEDVVNAQSQVTLLMSNDGRPGPALCEVARSGMLAEAIKQLSWFKLGKRKFKSRRRVHVGGPDLPDRQTGTHDWGSKQAPTRRRATCPTAAAACVDVERLYPKTQNSVG